MMKKILSILSLVAFLLPIVTISLVSGQSNLSHPYEKLFFEVLVLSIIVLVMVIALWSYNLLKFGSHTTDEPESYAPELLKKFQITWIMIPILIGIILLALSLPALSEFQNNLNYDGPTETVIVEGTAAWQWKFYYDNQTFLPVQDANGISETTLELTADTAYTFVLYSSGDLIHSFFVPELNFKEDVVPHRNNTITIFIEEAGEYDILCAEYCGARHSMMRGVIKVVAA